jgi:hypothetical protein
MTRRTWYFAKFDLLVDGYPRSANSVTGAAFELSQPATKVIYHRHLPPLVGRAVHQGVPVCLLIRRPIDAIASWCIYDGYPIEQAIDYYSDYYEAVSRWANRTAVVTFEEAISDFPSVVRRVALIYGVKLAVPEMTPAFSDAVDRKVLQLPFGGDELKVPLPNLRRADLVRTIREALSHTKYRTKLTRADHLYNLLLYVHAAQVRNASLDHA